MTRQHLVRSTAMAVLGVVLALPFPARVTAQDITVRLAGDASSLVGVDVNIPIEIDMTARMEKLGSFQLTLRWNTSVLKLVSRTIGTFGGTTNAVIDAEAGTLTVTGVSVAGMDGLFSVVVPTFKPLLAETTKLELSVGQLIASGTLADLTADAVTVDRLYCPAIGRKGDVDFDGAVNSRDALIDLSAAVGIITDPDLSVADVNGDGTIGAIDALIILSYSLGFDVPFAVFSIVPGSCATSQTLDSFFLVPGDTTVSPGVVVQYQAQATDASGATVAVSDVFWRVSDGRVAVVTPDGLVATLDTGSTVVTAFRRGTTDSAQATVTVVATPSPATSTITGAPAAIAADGTSTSTITVQLKDRAGGTFSTGGVVVTLATTLGTLGAVTDNDDGTYTATLTAGTAAGTATVTGTLNGTAITDNATVAFGPSPATTTITASPTSIPADGASTSTITVQTKDGAGTNLTTGGATVALSTTLGTLGAVTDNDDGTHTATLTSGTTVGEATITGELNGVAMTDDATVIFGPSDQPDLIVDSLLQSPFVPLDGDAVTIRAVVKNVGTADAGSSNLTIGVDGGASPPSFAVGPLVVGASASFQRVITLATGTHTATAVADANNDVGESDETNNSTSIQFEVEDQPPPGADIVVFNDFNPFDITAMSNANNRLMVRNLVNFTTTGPRNSGTVVLFDTGRNSRCAFCTSFSTLRSTITGEGFTIQDITSSSGTLTSFAANVKVIFLWLPTVTFTVDEVNALKQFAAQGGRVVFIGEWDGFYGVTGLAVENQLLTNLGAVMRNIGEAVDCRYNTLPASSLRPHQITTGMTDVTIACASVIVLGPGDFPLFFDLSNTKVLAGVAAIDTRPISVLAPPPLGFRANRDPGPLNTNSATGR